MIEIIPNWHPIFVHFTVALLSLATTLFVMGALIPATAGWKAKCLTVARWNLWVGAIITVGTLLAGMHAYNTVMHDEAGHIAMTDHRNWALATAAVFMALALWAFIVRKAKQASPLFVVVMVGATALLATTGYKGGELVFRHGLGVMALPQAEGEEGHHHHKEAHEHHHEGEEHHHAD